jgi:ABC-type lipoprotein export system ATPase subunit
MPLLELKAVCKQYGVPGAPAAVRVLEGVDLRVEAGEALAVVGPSGCGKSTLLNLAGALDAPSAGSVVFEGVALESLDEEALADLRNRQIGFVFQQHHLLPQCSALENVLVPTLAVRRSRAERLEAVERAEALLARVGLSARLAFRPGSLSGGEAQRVAVVRALINRPRLLLADEPTGSLDHAAADALGELLADLNREEGVALIVVTHSLELAARMGRLYRLDQGKLARER